MSYDTYKVNNKLLIETAEMDFIGADAFEPIAAPFYTYGGQQLKSYNALCVIGDSGIWEEQIDLSSAYTYKVPETTEPAIIGKEIDVSTMVNFGKIITIAGKAGTYNFFINRNTKSWECTYTDTNGITSTFFNNRNLNYFGNAAGKVGKLPSRFIIALWGAGGGGGGINAQSDEGAGGGGSGAFWCGVINTNANRNCEFTVTIGAGGRGGFNANNTNVDGIDGGDSSISITNEGEITSTLIVGGGKGGSSSGGIGGTIRIIDPSNYFYTLPLYEYSVANSEYEQMIISGEAVYASILGNNGGNALEHGGQPNLPAQSENNIRIYSNDNDTLAADFFKADTTYKTKASKWYTSIFTMPGGSATPGIGGGGGASAVSIQLSLGELLADEYGSAVAAKWTNGFKSCGGNGGTDLDIPGSDANTGSTDTEVPGGMGAGGGGAGGYGMYTSDRTKGGNGYNGTMILFALDDLTTVGADIK